jgi:signal transduction histidine kinase
MATSLSVSIAALTAPRRTLIAVWLVTGILLILTWWQAVAQVRDSRTREIASIERDLAHIAKNSQDHAARTLRNADQVIRQVQARYLEAGPQLNLTALTTEGLIDDEKIFSQIGIIDAQGIYALSSRPNQRPLNLSDHDYFKVHVAGNSNELFISQPLRERATGQWSIQLSRRISQPNGDFAGVVVLALDPAYFTRYYSELNLGPKALVALYGLDGVARARRIDTQDWFGTVAASAPLFVLLSQGELTGTYASRSVVDGIERIYYFRKIPDYALTVVAGFDTTDLLRQHQQNRDSLVLRAALVSLLLLALVVALTRHLRQLSNHMTTRLQTQQKTQDRTDHLDALFALSPHGLVSFDQRHCVRFVNPAFLQMTHAGNAHLEDLSEQDFSAWLAGRCKSSQPFPGIAHLRSRLEDQAEVRIQFEIDNEGKRLLQVGLRTSSASTVSQLLYFRDVTLESSIDEMKSEFLSTAAHELRTPMASIFGFAEVLLQQDLDPPTQKDFLTIIHTQSKLMANILDELLDLARIEERRGQDFRLTRLCLQDLTTDLVKAFTRPLGREVARLVMPVTPIYLVADAGKLQQAILNILSNAYKYSPAGSQVVITLDVKTEADKLAHAYIHISDQGTGMTPEQLSRVFERFYRADTSGKVPGTGLGMSIVKEIIELHHGSTTLVSALGVGTCVSLCLPAN